MFDYTTITELPGSALSPEQWARMHHRYAVARGMAKGRRVLEVACGAGMGLPALAQAARMTIGGDYTATVLATAQAAIQSTDEAVDLARFDAHALPFSTGSFDLVFIFEAIYYLADLGAFLDEARRVLVPGGQLLIVSENPAWRGFAPGRFYRGHWNTAELSGIMTRHGFDKIECYGAFPVTALSSRQRRVAQIRRFVLQTGLVPNHPGIRRLLQRVSYGKLHTLPAVLCATELGNGTLAPLAPDPPSTAYKVIYVSGVAAG